MLLTLSHRGHIAIYMQYIANSYDSISVGKTLDLILWSQAWKLESLEKKDIEFTDHGTFELLWCRFQN